MIRLNAGKRGLSVNFSLLEKQNISDKIFDILKQEIVEERITVGEKLPSEDALSKQFGVSKASVKAALQRLSALGLIETRVGQGSFVLEFDPRHYMDQVQDFLMSDSEIASIIEYRMYIEMAATRLAVKKATEENFKRMEEILDEMDKAKEEKNMDLHGQLDYLFHLEIWKSTKNSIFQMAYEIVGKMVLQHITILNKEIARKDKEFLTGKDEVHRHLFDAIKSKDLDSCRACYRKMFSVYEQLSPEQYQDS